MPKQFKIKLRLQSPGINTVSKSTTAIFYQLFNRIGKPIKAGHVPTLISAIRGLYA